MARASHRSGRSRVYRIIEVMARTDLHIKVVLDHEDGERPEKLAQEICRALLKMYGVRSVEVSNLVKQSDD